MSKKIKIAKTAHYKQAKAAQLKEDMQTVKDFVSCFALVATTALFTCVIIFCYPAKATDRGNALPSDEFVKFEDDYFPPDYSVDSEKPCFYKSGDIMRECDELTKLIASVNK